MQIRSKLKRTVVIALTVMMTIVCVLSQFVMTEKPVNTLSASAYTDQYEDFLFALGKRESNNNYSARGGSYLGRWQLGTSALQDAGFMNASGGWTALAKQYGVTSADTFLKSKAAQDYAVYLVHKKIWSYLKSNGAASYVGKTYQGLTITVAGLVGAAHLVGPYALKRAIANNTSASDSAGATAYSYMKLLGSYDISATIVGTSSTPTAATTVTQEANAIVTTTTTVAVPSADKENKADDKNDSRYDYDFVTAHGDVNKDGKINSSDATLVLIYYSEVLAGDDETLEEFVDAYLDATRKDNTEETTIASETTEATSETVSETETATDSSETSSETNETVDESVITSDDSISIIVNNKETEATTEVETEAATETTEEATETTEATTEEPSYFGDVNKDGEVNSIDAVIILQYYADSLVSEVQPKSDSSDKDEPSNENDTTQQPVDETETVVEETVAKTDVSKED